MLPVNLFLDRSNDSSEDERKKSFGRGPLRSLPRRSSCFSFGIVVRHSGISPDSKFLLSTKACSSVSKHNSVGSVPITLVRADGFLRKEKEMKVSGI